MSHPEPLAYARWCPPRDGADVLSPQEREALNHLSGSFPGSKGRRSMLRELAHVMAKLGATNDEIVRTLEERADAWGVLPPTNLWARYDYILRQIADARAAGAQGASRG